jgi:hypothetical protein
MGLSVARVCVALCSEATRTMMREENGWAADALIHFHPKTALDGNPPAKYSRSRLHE